MTRLRLTDADDGKVKFLSMFTASVDTPDSLVTLCVCGLPKVHLMLGTECGDVRRLEEVMAEASQSTNAHLERRDLRAFHRKLQDFLLRLTNVEGYAYRRARNSVIVYPPDGSAPITVFARNSERQLRSLNQWYEKHTGKTAPETAPEAVDATVDATVDSPDVTIPTPSTVFAMAQPVVHDPDDWQTHFDITGRAVENFETNGVVWRCRLCIGTDHEYESSESTGIGGHNRMMHGDTTSLFSPEARAKALDTRRFNRLSRQIEEAVVTLAHSIGWEAGPGVQERIEELERQNTALLARAEEAETRLAMIKGVYDA